MNRMRELNEKIMRRHHEVNQDRMDFERENPSKKLPPKKDSPKEERRVRCSEKRIVREWDAGKTSELSDRGSDDREQRYARSNKRGGYYDEKLNRRDGNWENYGNSYQRPSTSRMRNQDSRSYPHNKNTWRSSGQYQHKSNNSSNRDFKNWNNAPRRQQFSSNADNDKVWRNDELNEARHKQSRVENWVQSISTENWSDDDDDEYSKKQSNSRTKTANYGKKYEEPAHKTPYKNYNRRQYHEKIHQSSTSDSSYKEDRRPRYDGHHDPEPVRDNASNARGPVKDYTSNARGSDQQNYSRERVKKDRFKDRSPEYKNKASTSATSTKQRDPEFRNNHSRANIKCNNNRASDNWADKSDFENGWGSNVADKERSSAATATGGGGTWSDQEDYNNVDDNTSRNITTGWDQCASYSSNWENSESAAPRNRNNSAWNNQKRSGKSDSHKTNKGSEQTSSGNWSHQNSGKKPVRTHNRNFKKSDEKSAQWQADKNHINNRLLRYAYGENYHYGDFEGKKKDIEVVDLCSNSDTEYEPNHMQTGSETVNDQKCEEMCEVTSTTNWNIPESEAQGGSNFIVERGDFAGNLEIANVQDDSSVEILNDTYNESTENMRCAVGESGSESVLYLVGDKDLSVSLLSDEYEADITQCHIVNSSYFDMSNINIPCGENGFIEARHIPEEEFLEMGQSEHLNEAETENSSDTTLLISNTNGEKRKIPIGTSEDLSNSRDLLKESIEPSVSSSHSGGIISCCDSSGTKKRPPKEIVSFSKEAELEPIPGALLDDGWSTVTDENDSDFAEEGD
ncbi:probable elastin-binding protein EbpS isoform X2 [Parasteatoda tepidariorum]|nr:bifunctional endo-1,4-beta-xylanase XylA isoform X2 [Parasteatoda tepidariorum]